MRQLRVVISESPYTAQTGKLILGWPLCSGWWEFVTRPGRLGDATVRHTGRALAHEGAPPRLARSGNQHPLFIWGVGPGGRSQQSCRRILIQTALPLAPSSNMAGVRGVTSVHNAKGMAMPALSVCMYESDGQQRACDALEIPTMAV